MESMKPRQRLSALLVSTVCGLLTGCGSEVELAPVEGRVLYNSEPLSFGSVMFQPPRGQPASGVIQSDGTFVLDTVGAGDGAAVGRNKVRVTCFEAQDPNAKPDQFGEGLGRSLIPKKYNQYDTSGIEVEVSPDQNDRMTIELAGSSEE